MVQSRLGNSAPIVVLGLDRVGLLGPAEPADQPAEVGVDGDAGDAERVAEDDVRGLAADAGQLDQVVEPGRHLAVVPLDERGASLSSDSVLARKKPSGPMISSSVGAVGGGHRLRVGVGREERRADGVDPLVGGLRAQHRDDEQLERVVEVELAAASG